MGQNGVGLLNGVGENGMETGWVDLAWEGAGLVVGLDHPGPHPSA